MSKAAPQCPVTAASTALERQQPWGVWEGWCMCWWSALQMEQVACKRLIWDKAMPHVSMLGENGMPYTSTAASSTLGACAHDAVEAAQGDCVTQLFSGPAYHLLPLIADESFQKYLETWAAFSPMSTERPLYLTASSKEATAEAFGKFDSLQKARVYWSFPTLPMLSCFCDSSKKIYAFSNNEQSIFIIKANGIYVP